MSDTNNNTEQEDLNETIKKTIRVNISEDSAERLLAELGARVPPVGELDEIHLVITH